METINALGRRKSAVARVFLTEGTGKITINKRDLTEYFPSSILQFVVKQPLQLLEVLAHFTNSTLKTNQLFARQVSLLAILVRLNVRSQVSQKHVVASSSANVNRHCLLNWRLVSKPSGHFFRKVYPMAG